jgi:hypothetical protein
MKKLRISLIISTLLFSLMSLRPAQTKAQVSVSFQFFYDNLSPYGTWVDYPGYGYAWVPAHVVHFRPYYTGGHWAFTEMGWMWVSDYDWGWAPFHYGSWVLDPLYGWVWVPGYDWAPAWVTWGYYDGYYGWAPCAPGYRIYAGYRPPIDYWVFAHPHYMMTGELVQHSYPAYNRRISIGSNTITDVQRISAVSNTAQQSGRTYFAGPSQQEFQRNANTSVKPVVVREAPKVGRTELSGNAVNIYRPRVTQMEDAHPSRVSKLEDVKPAVRNDNAVKPDVSPQSQPRGTDVQSRPRETKPTQTKPESPRNVETPREVKPAPQPPHDIRPKEAPRQREVSPPSKAPEQPRQIERQPRQPREMQQPRQNTPREIAPGRSALGGQPQAMPPMQRSSSKGMAEENKCHLT